jgi:DNA (cytosine-5)-methyltransferase 1
MKNTKLRGLSLFSSAGIAEFGFSNTEVDIVLANEIIKKRMDVHKYWHPKSETVCGDITNKEVKSVIINLARQKKVDFILATPPCQGVSLIGKNKSNDEMLNDARNFLIFDVLEIIDILKPKAILIENVKRFLKLKFPHNGSFVDIEFLIRQKYSRKYNIDVNVFNSRDYGVPQNRERAIIRLWNDNFTWNDPKIEMPITVKEAIGHLPPLESGEKSAIYNHQARNHTPQHILYMKNTPTGKSAFQNSLYFPKNELTGERLKGYAATYKRIDWDKPAPTITMRNDCISSQSNVHPGRLLKDGTYSDARVLTIRELFILSSINPDLKIPDFASDIQIRHMIGEAVPPKLIYKILSGLKHK